MYEERKKLRPIYTVELALVIKDSDTLGIHELNCVDSLKFTRTLIDIKVDEMCVEMGMQGKTYFSARTNKYGGFEEVKVLRSLDQCFKSLEEKIEKKILSMRIVPEEAGSYEILFYHQLRLD